MSRPLSLTKRQEEILKHLLRKGHPVLVFTVEETQENLARELGVSRQALSLHLKRLKESGLVRTGRGFIDVTEKALEALGLRAASAFVVIRVEPRTRPQAYEEITKLPVERVYRVAGDVDLLVEVNQAVLDEFLRRISKIDGVKETRTYVAIERLK